MWGPKLAGEVEAANKQSKGKHKGKKTKGKEKVKETGRASEHQEPRRLEQLSEDEQWYVKQFWNGYLKQKMKTYACPVQADDFYVGDND